MPAARDQSFEPSTIDALPFVGAFTTGTFAPNTCPKKSDSSWAANRTTPLSAESSATISALSRDSATSAEAVAANNATAVTNKTIFSFFIVDSC